MVRDNIKDILAFLTVAREGSFTRAAAKTGVSQSALSHSIRVLETRLGVRLLARMTRSCSPTEAGEQLIRMVAPRLQEIEADRYDIGVRCGDQVEKDMVAQPDVARSSVQSTTSRAS